MSIKKQLEKSKEIIRGNWFLVKKHIFKQKFMFYRNEGELIPKFYLPVRWHLNKGTLECWVFYLAFFIWVFYVIRNVFWSIIGDAVEWEKMLAQKWKGFKNVK